MLYLVAVDKGNMGYSSLPPSPEIPLSRLWESAELILEVRSPKRRIEVLLGCLPSSLSLTAYGGFHMAI